MTKANCIIEGCAKPIINRRGWCSSHYHRWLNHGDPLGGRAPDGSGVAFIKSITNENIDDCLFWPFGKNSQGYGIVTWENRKSLAHRVVCELFHGPSPQEGMYARHLCGNGHLGCCNPQHLAWGTPTENRADAKGHGVVPCGENHVRNKLTENDVRRIRSLVGKKTQFELADMFGVTRSGIQSILRGKSWAWLK